MKYLTTLFKNLIKEVPKPLGRWNIEKCSKKIKYKVDQANEDNCGPCGHYHIQQIEYNNQAKIQETVVLKKILL